VNIKDEQILETSHCSRPAANVSHTSTGKITLLVQDARSGNRGALEELTKQFKDKIFHMVFYRTGNVMDAEDITQETFLQMIKSLPHLKDPKRFSAWLYRIAVNRIKDYHRKKKLLHFLGIKPARTPIEMDIKDSAYNPADSVLQQAFWQQFFQAMDTLPSMEREVFILRFVDQLQIKEIVHVLGKKESTIKTHLYRGVKKIKHHPTFYTLLKDGPL
jgi:RNA polymerase sigma-70 factor (ECF subfamily)